MDLSLYVDARLHLEPGPDNAAVNDDTGRSFMTCLL